MPYLFIVPIACGCPELPKKLSGIGIGSVWECPDCYRQWKLAQQNGFQKEGVWKQLPEDQWLPSPNRNDAFDVDFIKAYEAKLQARGWRLAVAPNKVNADVATSV